MTTQSHQTHGVQIPRLAAETNRGLMAAVDESIAKYSSCRHCQKPVYLMTTPPSQPYQAWLVCTNPGCGRKTPLE